jgi:chitodextrinase
MISWRSSRDNVGTYRYEIRRNAEAWRSHYVNEYATAELKATETFEVRAIDISGNYSMSALLRAKDVAAPSQPTQLRATEVTHASVTLEWAASSDDSGHVVYEIYQDNTVIDVVNEPRVVVTGLADMTTYFFKVRALDAAWNGVDSDPLTVTTTDSAIPAKPTMLALLPIQDKFALVWSHLPDVVGYEVFRNGKSLGTVDTPFLMPVEVAEPYAFKVRALYANGKYADSEWYLSGENQPPGKPGNLRATRITGNSVTLEWAPSTDNVVVAGYRVYLNSTIMPMVEGTRFTALGLTEGTTYRCRVRAFDADGNYTDSDTLPVTTAIHDITPPSKPTNLRATTITHTSVTLQWNAASDNVGVIGYEVYIGGVWFTFVPGTTHTVKEMAEGATYIFKVRAMDAAGNGTDSDTLTVTTTRPDTTAPSKPTNLRVIPFTGSSVFLLWDAASDDVGVDHYEIYRNRIKIATEPGTQVLVADLAGGTSYLFEVRAVDAASNAGEFVWISFTNPGSDTLPPSTPGNLRAFAITSNAARLSWSPSTDNIAVTGYEIWHLQERIDTVPELQYLVTNLYASTTYTLRVYAVDAAGNRSEPNSVEVTTLVSNGPTNLTFERSGATFGALQWNPPVDSSGVTGYQLSRDRKVLGEIPQTNHLFMNLTPGVTHLFEVRANRNGTYSDAVHIRG